MPGFDVKVLFEVPDFSHELLRCVVAEHPGHGGVCRQQTAVLPHLEDALHRILKDAAIFALRDISENNGNMPGAWPEGGRIKVLSENVGITLKMSRIARQRNLPEPLDPDRRNLREDRQNPFVAYRFLRVSRNALETRIHVNKSRIAGNAVAVADHFQQSTADIHLMEQLPVAFFTFEQGLRSEPAFGDIV